MTRVYTEGRLYLCFLWRKENARFNNAIQSTVRSSSVYLFVGSFILSFTLRLLSVFQSIYWSTHAKLGSLFSFQVIQFRISLQRSVIHIRWHHPKHVHIICVLLRLLGMGHCSVEMHSRAEEIHNTIAWTLYKPYPTSSKLQINQASLHRKDEQLNALGKATANVILVTLKFILPSLQSGSLTAWELSARNNTTRYNLQNRSSVHRNICYQCKVSDPHHALSAAHPHPHPVLWTICHVGVVVYNNLEFQHDLVIWVIYVADRTFDRAEVDLAAIVKLWVSDGGTELCCHLAKGSVIFYVFTHTDNLQWDERHDWSFIHRKDYLQC